MHTSSRLRSSPIAVVGLLVSALAVASLARMRPAEAPPVSRVERPLATCVDLNRATSSELESLPRVGPSLAARIMEARPFAYVDELDRVRGIGPATLRVLRPRLCELRVSTRNDALPDAGPPR